MVLNICKYQIPYIQYNLFENYIAENLCVNRYDKDSCCHGKCFLEKQIDRTDETDNDSSNPATKKQVKGIDDYVMKEVLLQKPNLLIEIQLLSLTDARLPKISLDISIPPPKRFI
jgi:hypothetical protein